VLLAITEERLGNLDDSLLAIYEGDRLADEEQNSKFRKLLHTMQVRVEGKMARDTKRVLEQIPMFGDIQSGSKSREKLTVGLSASLKLIIGKLNADGGFVAIPSASGKPLDVVCRENIKRKDAKALLAWHASHADSRDSKNGLLITDANRNEGLSELGRSIGFDPGTVVFQGLGFESDSLGMVVIYQAADSPRSPVEQESLHFVGAYSRLISLSVYELLRNERCREPKAKPKGSGLDNIVTDNTEMIKLLNLAERVAHSNATVLLQGETGTGKGLIAYAIHLLSDRREKRFVHVNCAAMPESLLESELFGHVRGAFTGAIADKQGLLREADGGTIFLDEIGKTSLTMQGKLLQFLDNSKVRKVGSNELLPVNVRVICASKADLLMLCDEGRFLEDFFYRINDFPLTVPPLRKRREDIPLLFFHYLRKFSREMDKNIVDINDDAMELLKSFHWAGNVRELEKVVKRAVILAEDGDSLSARHLPLEVVSASKREGRRQGQLRSLRSKIELLEKREIQAALEHSGWNKTRAALELGVSYPSLLSKIKRYNLRNY
jgi:transcriptional regulator with GAF, ATPase, and Fis domain